MFVCLANVSQFSLFCKISPVGSGRFRSVETIKVFSEINSIYVNYASPVVSGGFQSFPVASGRFRSSGWPRSVSVGCVRPRSVPVGPGRFVDSSSRAVGSTKRNPGAPSEDLRHDADRRSYQEVARVHGVRPVRQVCGRRPPRPQTLPAARHIGTACSGTDIGSKVFTKLTEYWAANCDATFTMVPSLAARRCAKHESRNAERKYAKRKTRLHETQNADTQKAKRRWAKRECEETQG